MNRNISNFYSKQIDVGYATERDIYDALYAGIRDEDLNLVDKSLSMLPSQAKWDNDDYPDPMDFAIDEMASNDIFTILIDRGYSLDHYPPRLSLFNFSPKEMISFYKKNYPEKIILMKKSSSTSSIISIFIKMKGLVIEFPSI